MTRNCGRRKKIALHTGWLFARRSFIGFLARHPQPMQEVKMKMWKLFLLMLICSGLCVAFGLSGCGDNPCENAEPTTCAGIEFAVPGRCLVVGQDDFACTCCTSDDGILCDTPGTKIPDPLPPELLECELSEVEASWDENTKTCLPECPPQAPSDEWFGIE